MTSSDVTKDALVQKEAAITAARGAIIRMAGYGVGIGANIVSTWLLLHYFTVSENGRYGTVFSLLTIVSGIAEAGMTIVGIREYVRQNDHERILMMRSLLGLRIVAVFSGVVVATIFSISQNYDSDMISGVVIGGLGTVLILSALTFGIPLHASLRLGWVAALDAIRQVGIATFVALVVLLKGSFFQVLLAPVPTGVILLAVALFVIRDHRLLLPTFNRTEWKRLLRLAGPMTIAATVGTLYFFLTQILMLAVTTEEEAGIYAASFRIFIALVTAPMLIVSSFFPILTHADHTGDSQRFKNGVAQLVQLCLLLSGFTAFMVVSLSPLIIDVLASAAYAQVQDVLVIHGCALAGTFLASCGGFSLLALGRNRTVLFVNIVGLIVNITAVFIFVKFDGARGAAFANLLGELTLAAGYWLALHRAGIRWDLKLTIRAFIPSLIIIPLLFADLGSIMTFTLGSLIFLMTTMLAGVIPPNLIRRLLRPLASFRR